MAKTLARRNAPHPKRVLVLQLEKARRPSLQGVATDLEREALSILGITTAKQVERLDDSNAADFEKLLKFADLWFSSRNVPYAPGALTTAVRRVEAQCGLPFQQTPIAERLNPSAFEIDPITLSIPESGPITIVPKRTRLLTAATITGLRAGFEGILSELADYDSSWRRNGRARVARIAAMAKLPETLRPYVEPISSPLRSESERIDAVRELAGRIPNSGRPPLDPGAHEKARSVWDAAYRSGASKKEADFAAGQACGRSSEWIRKARKSEGWEL